MHDPLDISLVSTDTNYDPYIPSCMQVEARLTAGEPVEGALKQTVDPERIEAVPTRSDESSVDNPESPPAGHDYTEL